MNREQRTVLWELGRVFGSVFLAGIFVGILLASGWGICPNITIPR